MFDAPPVVQQRAKGEAVVGLALRNGRTVLRDLRQAGSAKAILPRVEDGVPEIVFLNTAGGLTGGDSYDYRLTLADGCRAVATTQTAERAYESSGGSASVRFRLEVGARARLDWLPQETILFERSALTRETVIDLAPDAACVSLETVVLGRVAMGEVLASVALSDRRTIRRAGRPVFVEPLHIDTGVLASAGRPAMLGGARAIATLVLVAQGAEDAVGALRPLLNEAGVDGATSGFDGKCVVRLLAADGWPLRKQLLRILPVMTGRALPRVWQI